MPRLQSCCILSTSASFWFLPPYIWCCTEFSFLSRCAIFYPNTGNSILTPLQAGSKYIHIWGKDNFLWLVVQAFFAFFLTWLVSRACLDLILPPVRHLHLPSPSYFCQVWKKQSEGFFLSEKQSKSKALPQVALCPTFVFSKELLARGKMASPATGS